MRAALLLPLVASEASARLLELLALGGGEVYRAADPDDLRYAARRDDGPSPFEVGVLFASRLSGSSLPRGAGVPLVVLDDAGLDDAACSRLIDAGADDVLPAARLDQLLPRLRRSVLRAAGHAGGLIECGPISLDPASRGVRYEGREVRRICGRQYDLLELLALRVGRCVTREQALDRLYFGRDEPDAKTLDVFVSKLRREVAAASGGLNFIQTVWGRGWILHPSPQEPPLQTQVGGRYYRGAPLPSAVNPQESLS